MLIRDVSEQVGVPVSPVVAGQELRLGKGAVLRVVEVGESWAVLLLEWQKFRVLLLTGDSPKEPEAQALANQIGTVTALVLVETSINPAEMPGWVVSLGPRVVIPLTLDGDLEASPGFTLLSVEQNDSIDLITDSEQMWVDVERR